GRARAAAATGQAPEFARVSGNARRSGQPCAERRGGPQSHDSAVPRPALVAGDGTPAGLRRSVEAGYLDGGTMAEADANPEPGRGREARWPSQIPSRG